AFCLGRASPGIAEVCCGPQHNPACGPMPAETASPLRQPKRTRMAHYRRALDLNPDHAEARSDLGYALKEQGHGRNGRCQLGLKLRTNPSVSPLGPALK